MSQDMKKIEGHLDTHIECGAEIGTIWTLEEAVTNGFDGVHFLEDGDLLTIFNDEARKEKLWEGTIKLDYHKAAQPNHMIPNLITQHAGPFSWANGIQSDVDPDQWGQWFWDKKPATLVRPAARPGPSL